MINAELPQPQPRQSRAESREATRSRLVDSAIELYSGYGVNAVSLQLIAEHAGYSRGAFHSNFRDKEELNTAVVSAVIAAIAPQLSGILATGTDINAGPGTGIDAVSSTATDGVQRLGEYIRRYVQFCAENPQKAQALIAIVGNQAQQRGGSYEARADDSLTDIVALFEAGQAAGEMRDFDPSIMALMLRSSLDAHSMRFTRNASQSEQRASESGQPEWRRMADEIATTFQLATQKVNHD